MHKNTETDTQTLTPAAFTFSVLTHLQPHADRHVRGHLIHTASLFQPFIVYLCVVVLSFLLLGRGCVPCSRHLPIPWLACATLHLQGIKSEPPESTKKKDKKIGPNENQKHRLSLFLSLSLLLLLSLPLLPWTWKDERGGELNLIQTSSPQGQMTGLWSVSVRVWVFRSLILSLLSCSPLFFYERRGKALKLCTLTICWLLSWALLPLKDRVYFLLQWASPGPLLHGWGWISPVVTAHNLETF